MKQKRATVNAMKQSNFRISKRHLEPFPVLMGLEMLPADRALHRSQSIGRFGDRLI